MRLRKENMKRLEQIRERLEAVTTYKTLPHRKAVNTAGDRHGVVDSSGCVVTMDGPLEAEFYAHIPSDTLVLLKVAEMVVSKHQKVEGAGWNCQECGPEKWPCATFKTVQNLLEGK